MQPLIQRGRSNATPHTSHIASRESTNVPYNMLRAVNCTETNHKRPTQKTKGSRKYSNNKNNAHNDKCESIFTKIWPE